MAVVCPVGLTLLGCDVISWEVDTVMDHVDVTHFGGDSEFIFESALSKTRILLAGPSEAFDCLGVMEKALSEELGREVIILSFRQNLSLNDIETLDLTLAGAVYPKHFSNAVAAGPEMKKLGVQTLSVSGPVFGSSIIFNEPAVGPAWRPSVQVESFTKTPFKRRPYARPRRSINLDDD